MLDVKKTLAKLLGMMPYTSTIATKVTVLRFGAYRLLHFNDATGSVISGITLATTDRPSEDERAVGIRRTSTAGGSSLGMIVLRASTGKINPYYVGTYGGSITALGTTDTITASLFYRV